jgi:hypothetical protein
MRRSGGDGGARHYSAYHLLRWGSGSRLAVCMEFALFIF